MTLVEAREINPPANEEPLHWRLLTTIAVGDAAAACEIIRLYRLRWRIEEVFRALKSAGMRLEETQVHEAKRLFKLAVVGLASACRTIQLVDARDGGPRPATDVVDPALLPVAEAIGATLEGKTERQKNRHPLHSLAWLSWIIARLGGWNCYYKPEDRVFRRIEWLAIRLASVFRAKKHNMDDLQGGWHLREKHPWDKICISSGCIVGSKHRSGQSLTAAG